MSGEAEVPAQYHRSPEVIERHLGAEVVVLLPSGDFTVLVGGAAAVWAAVGSDRVDLDQICSRVFAGPTPSDERAHVREMVDALVDIGALVPR